jgi:DNA mismatch repair ATPase MutL
MGCGGSKEAPRESIPLEQPRVATARAPTSHRPRTSQNRPVSKQHSQRPPSSSTRPSTNSKRSPSSSARPSSSSNQPSSSNRPSGSKRTDSGHGGRRPKSSYLPQPTIYEDNIPEDNDITEGIIILCTLIDQHAESFFGVDYASYARRTIGEALVSHIVAGGGDGTAPFLFPD